MSPPTTDASSPPAPVPVLPSPGGDERAVRSARETTTQPVARESTTKVAAVYPLWLATTGTATDSRGAVVIDSTSTARPPSPPRYGGTSHRRIYRRYGPTTDTRGPRFAGRLMPPGARPHSKTSNKQLLRLYRLQLAPATPRPTSVTGRRRRHHRRDPPDHHRRPSLHWTTATVTAGGRQLRGLANASTWTFLAYTGVGLLERRASSPGTLGTQVR